MESELDGLMSRILGVVLPMLLAWLSAGVVAHFLGKGKKGSLRKEGLKQTRYVVDKIVISLFLPLISMFAILKSDIQPAHLAFWGLGFVFPMATLIAGLAFHAFSSERRDPPTYWKPFMPATFGGGNRGTLLIITLSPFAIDWLQLSMTTEEMIGFFALFDLGNFIFLTFVIRYGAMPRYARSLVDRSDEGRRERGIRKTEPEKDPFKWLPGLAILLALIPSFLDQWGLLAWMRENPLAASISHSFLVFSSHLPLTFSFLTFLSIFILFREEGGTINLGGWIRAMGLGLLARAFGLGAASLLLHLFVTQPDPLILPAQMKAALFCLWVFLILPPSSLFSLFVEEENQQLGLSDQEDDHNGFKRFSGSLSGLVYATNHLYLLIMLLAALVASYQLGLV